MLPSSLYQTWATYHLKKTARNITPVTILYGMHPTDFRCIHQLVHTAITVHMWHHSLPMTVEVSNSSGKISTTKVCFCKSGRQWSCWFSQNLSVPRSV